MGENIMQKRVKWAHKSLALCVILLAKRNNTRPKSGRQHIMQRAHLQTYSHSCNAKQTNNGSSINTRKKRDTIRGVHSVERKKMRKEKGKMDRGKGKGTRQTQTLAHPAASGRDTSRHK